MITNNVIAVDEESNVFNNDNKNRKDQNNRKNNNHQIYLKMFFLRTRSSIFLKEYDK